MPYDHTITAADPLGRPSGERTVSQPILLALREAMMDQQIITPAKRAVPVQSACDYIAAAVESASASLHPTTAAEWIDAVQGAGLKLSLSYDGLTGAPLSFQIEPCVPGWERFQRLVNQIGEDKIRVELHRRAVGDPLLDLLERFAVVDARARATGTDDEANALWNPIHDEQINAPAASTFRGVLAGLEWGAAEVEGSDLCGDGVLRGAIGGLREILSRPTAQTVAVVLAGRDEPEGDLLPLIEADSAACQAFNNHTLDEGEEHERLERVMHAAGAALEEALITRGQDCKTYAEAKAAAARSLYYYRNQDDLSAALALSALAVFLGEEAVS